jgi:hypothetical protein
MRTRSFFLAALVLVTALAGASSAAAAQEPVASPAVQTLSRCVQDSGRVAAVLLVDASVSLRQSDPDEERFAGLDSALDGLADIAELRRGATVDVLPMTFAAETLPTDISDASWIRLGSKRVNKVVTDRVRQLSDPLRGDTDYATALKAARDALAQRLRSDAARATPPCGVLFFFTDGEFAIRDRTAPGNKRPGSVFYAPGVDLRTPGGGVSAINAGKDYLCAPKTGLLDSLVSTDRIVKFTIALNGLVRNQRTRKQERAIKDADVAFLKALTSGGVYPARDGTTKACGSLLSERTGQFLPVDDTASLFLDLSEIGGPRGARCSSRPRQSVGAAERAGGRPCERAGTKFRVVPGIARFDVRASTGADGTDLYLIPPGSKRELRFAPLDETPVTVDGVTLTPRWSSRRNVVIRGEIASGTDAANGAWALVFVDPRGRNRRTVAQSSIRFATDVRPALRSRPTLFRGEEPTQLDVTLRSERGVSGLTELLASAVLEASVLVSADAQLRAIDVPPAVTPGRFTFGVQVPEDVRTPTVLLDLVARFEAIDGVPVLSSSTSLRLESKVPDAYPQVSATELRFPTLEGAGTSRQMIRLRGPRDGDGCAWFLGPKVQAPDDAGKVIVKITPDARTKQECLRVPKGGSATAEVAITTERPTLGTVRVTVPVQLSSEIRTQEDPTVELLGRLSLQPANDTAFRIFLFLLFGTLGTLLPLIVLHLLNTRIARVASPRMLRSGVYDVLLTRESLVEKTAGVPLQITRENEPVRLDRSGGRVEAVRAFELHGLAVKAVATGSLADRRLRLFAGPYAVVDGLGEGDLVGSLAGVHPRLGSGRRVEVPLEVGAFWIYRPDAAMEAEGVLILVIPDGGDPEMAARKLLAHAAADLCQRAPETSEGPDEEISGWDAGPSDAPIIDY